MFFGWFLDDLNFDIGRVAQLRVWTGFGVLFFMDQIKKNIYFAIANLRQISSQYMLSGFP